MTPCTPSELLAVIESYPFDDSFFWLTSPPLLEFNSWLQSTIPTPAPSLQQIQTTWAEYFPDLPLPSLSRFNLWNECLYCTAPVTPHHPFLDSQPILNHPICDNCRDEAWPADIQKPEYVKPKKAKKAKKKAAGPKSTIEKHHPLFAPLAESDPYYYDPFYDDPYYQGVREFLQALEMLDD